MTAIFDIPMQVHLLAVTERNSGILSSILQRTPLELFVSRLVLW